jgi:hypothetical protein
MNTLKMVCALRKRRVKIKADIYDIEMDMKAGFITERSGADRVYIKNEELRFINELLDENG